MFAFPASLRIYVAVAPVDMRKQFNGLWAHAQQALGEDHREVIHVGCLAHIRRPFHDALQEAPVQTGFVLRLIGHLYAYEKSWDEAGPDRTRPARCAPANSLHPETGSIWWTTLCRLDGRFRGHVP